MRGLSLWCLPLVVACAGAAEDGSGATSPTAAPATATQLPADLCADAPVVTWNNWGQGFMIGACQPCHASTAPDRQGAPEGVVFDTHNDARTFKERILARSTGASPDMPPAGGVSEEDRHLLEIWLRCYEE